MHCEVYRPRPHNHAHSRYSSAWEIVWIKYYSNSLKALPPTTTTTTTTTATTTATTGKFLCSQSVGSNEIMSRKDQGFYD